MEIVLSVTYLATSVDGRTRVIHGDNRRRPQKGEILSDGFIVNRVITGNRNHANH